jgi:hypothetical protein
MGDKPSGIKDAFVISEKEARGHGLIDDDKDLLK